ncbi:MAG: toll/interleukin-1 receptor domain-containing protein [bacterium]|nr:MAG: toll/interleukin-1 receptor domain-containing protein [bacterium]
MSEKKLKKIFLFYAHIDLGYAKKLYDDLKRYGLEIWFDKQSLLPGQDWEKGIRKAIRESDFFTVDFSASTELFSLNF